MRCYLFLPVVLSAVFALRLTYKKNVVFTLMPGKTTCFHKQVSRLKVIEVEYQVLETEGMRSNMTVSMDVVAPHAARRRVRVVAAQRGAAGAHVLDALVAGVYRFCFDNSFDVRNNKTILFNLTIRTKKKLMKKKNMSAKEKMLKKKLKRLKNKKRHKEMLNFLQTKTDEEDILMPQRKGKNQMNSSNKLIKKKKKKKSSGRIKKNKKEKVLSIWPDITNKQKNSPKTTKWFFDENKEKEIEKDSTQKDNKSKQLKNYKIKSFIPVTDGKSTNTMMQYRNQPESEYIVKRPIDEKITEGIAWPDKKKVLQNQVRANYAQPMNENTVKEILQRLTDNERRMNKYKRPMNTQITRIDPRKSQEPLSQEDEDEDEEIMSQQEEDTTNESRTELLNEMEMRQRTTKKNDFNIDSYPTVTKTFDLNIGNYPTATTAEGFDMNVGDYPSIDYSSDKNDRWLRSEESRTTSEMFMPYNWNMIV